MKVCLQIVLIFLELLKIKPLDMKDLDEEEKRKKGEHGALLFTEKEARGYGCCSSECSD